MTTYHVANQQLPSIGAVASDDEIVVYDATDDKPKLATVTQLSAAIPAAEVFEATTSGAVPAGVRSVEINSVAAVALTIADAADHPGLFVVKHVSSSDGQNHTLTLTSGTYDGSDNVALLNAANEALAVYFDSAGDGTIIANVGSVSLG